MADVGVARSMPWQGDCAWSIICSSGALAYLIGCFVSYKQVTKLDDARATWQQRWINTAASRGRDKDQPPTATRCCCLDEAGGAEVYRPMQNQAGEKTVLQAFCAKQRGSGP